MQKVRKEQEGQEEVGGMKSNSAPGVGGGLLIWVPVVSFRYHGSRVAVVRASFIVLLDSHCSKNQCILVGPHRCLYFPRSFLPSFRFLHRLSRLGFLSHSSVGHVARDYEICKKIII